MKEYKDTKLFEQIVLNKSSVLVISNNNRQEEIEKLSKKFQIASPEKVFQKDKVLNDFFDYIFLYNEYNENPSYLVQILKNIRAYCKPETRVILINEGTNFCLGKEISEIKNLIDKTEFEVICIKKREIIKRDIAILSPLLNKYLSQIWPFSNLCRRRYFFLRPKNMRKKENSCSIIVPARNEEGNIERLIKEMPKFCKKMEIIFVEGGSSDGTYEEIKRVAKKYKKEWDIKYFKQDGKGKGDAVRKGFEKADGDILMILDADLTVSPKDLKKFYDVLDEDKGEFANGSRMLYKMEKGSMRFLNKIGNKFFSYLLSWILEQKFTDTLCGTKVLFKKDYERIRENRDYFGDFDPFGDFDLIFGAARANLKIVEVPIHYKRRTYGDTNIRRFRDGWLLLKMCFFAIRKIKFI